MPPSGDPGGLLCTQERRAPTGAGHPCLGQQDAAEWRFTLTYFLGIVHSVLMYSDTSSRKTVHLDMFLITIPAS